MEFNQT